MPSEAERVGEAVREERLKAGLSLGQLAEATGISKAHLVRLETKESSNPSLDILSRIADALEITVADLVGRPRLTYQPESEAEFSPSLQAFADEENLSSGEIHTLASIKFRGGERPRTVKRWRYIYDSLRLSEGFDQMEEKDGDADEDVD